MITSMKTKMTLRQREVLQLVAEGRSVKEIASALAISTKTAEFHKYNVMKKLGIRTTAELTKYAVKHGMVKLGVLLAFLISSSVTW